MLNTIYLSLGSNLGDREGNLHHAIDALEREGIRILRLSSLYETEPRDVPDQPWFLNLAVAGETRWLPLRLLDLLHKIEREAGRVRTAGSIRRGPRTLDIDILLFGDTILNTPRLTIPHPRMRERRFVLEPLLEIAPDLRHPATHDLLSKHLPGVADQCVNRLPAA